MKTPLTKIKSLPLEYWMTCMGSGLYSPPLATCSPAYNIDGYYYDDKFSKLCWFEYGGKAWVYDAKAFLYNYNLTNQQTAVNSLHAKIEPYVGPALKHAATLLVNHFTKRK